MVPNGASIRAERSRPIVTDLFAMLEKELQRLSGKSKLAEIIRYTLSPRTAFERFLPTFVSRSAPTSSNAPSATDHYPQECAVRRLRWRRPGPGYDRNTAHHG